MVELREAVTTSRRFLRNVFEDELPPLPAETLEGIELSEDMKFWRVTFSYWSGPTKKYKTVKLRAEDGIPLGIMNSDL